MSSKLYCSVRLLLDIIIIIEIEFKSFYSNSLSDSPYSRNTSSATHHYLMYGSSGHVVISIMH